MVGFIKGKSAIHLARVYGEKKRILWGNTSGLEGNSSRPSFISARLERKGETLTGEIDLPVRGDRKIPLKNVSASDTRLSFEVPGASGNLLFEGRHQDGKIVGQCAPGALHEPLRADQADRDVSETYTQIAGNYELAPGRVILIARSPSGAIYLDHAANRMGVLYPIGERTFVSGPSLIAGFPVELTVTFDAPPVMAMPTLRADDGAGDGSGEGFGAGEGNGGPHASLDAIQPSASRLLDDSGAPVSAGFAPGLTWHVKGQPPHARRAQGVLHDDAATVHASGSASLSGTLVTPNGPGPHPAVVMIHGSGRRRATPCGRGPTLRAPGVAVLIHDKRGTGARPATGRGRRSTIWRVTRWRAGVPPCATRDQWTPDRAARHEPRRLGRAAGRVARAGRRLRDRRIRAGVDAARSRAAARRTAAARGRVHAELVGSARRSWIRSSRSRARARAGTDCDESMARGARKAGSPT